MKKIFLLIMLGLFVQPVLASLDEENKIQARIDSVGINLLNANRIQKHIVFAYQKDVKGKLSVDKTLTKRQVVVYDDLYKYVQTDDELAGMLAREISSAVKSFQGAWGGRIDSIEVALGSKKFEIVADKRAIDYMVNAGYNPLGLIVFISKSCPQKHGDRIGRHNLTSKRLARMYEYITYKYPEYLNSDYVDNKYYQNFLLQSVDNRAKLEEKIRTKSTREINYE